MMKLNEQYVVNTEGKPVAVILDIEVFQQLIRQLESLEQAQPSVSDAAWWERWQAFLSRARTGKPLPDSALSRESLYGDD